LLRKLARGKNGEGDEASRTTPENGIPGWREALSYYDQGLKFAIADPDIRSLTRAREAVARKIYRAYFARAEDKRRMAENQRGAVLEQAVEQMEEAISDYTEALVYLPADRAAKAALEQVQRIIEPWWIEYAGQQHEEGNIKRRASFLEDAVALWQKAAGLYAKVLERNPSSAAALRGQKKNNQALHDGHVGLGDGNQRDAGQGFRNQKDRDALYDAAVAHYRSALEIQPDSAVAAGKLNALGVKLADGLAARGYEEYGEGRRLARPKPSEAIGWLERAVQSFDRSLAFRDDHAKAQRGKQDAQALLAQLRALDAENQRRQLAENKTLQNAQEIEDPGKAALKLLDYQTEALASKKEQNLRTPEDRSVRDW
jgi:hypothetical protein